MGVLQSVQIGADEGQSALSYDIAPRLPSRETPNCSLRHVPRPGLPTKQHGEARLEGPRDEGAPLCLPI